RASASAPGWMAVEARWGAVMVWNTRASRALDAGDAVTARAFAGRALAVCDAGRDQLGDAPVNGVELVEDCAAAAGIAGDDRQWRGWARWWVRRELDVRGTVDPAVVARIVRSAAPDCAGIQVGPDGAITPAVDRAPRATAVTATEPATGTPSDEGDAVADAHAWASWCVTRTSRVLRCADPTPRADQLAGCDRDGD
ncbi:MAG: hypothetical protein ABMB14_19860, partial [Myxococcota bacterium]